MKIKLKSLEILEIGKVWEKVRYHNYFRKMSILLELGLLLFIIWSHFLTHFCNFTNNVIFFIFWVYFWSKLAHYLGLIMVEMIPFRWFYGHFISENSRYDGFKFTGNRTFFILRFPLVPLVTGKYNPNNTILPFVWKLMLWVDETVLITN